MYYRLFDSSMGLWIIYEFLKCCFIDATLHFGRLWLVYLTCPLSIQLEPHGDVSEPRVGFDFYVTRIDTRPQGMRNDAVTIVVGREDLEQNR